MSKKGVKDKILNCDENISDDIKSRLESNLQYNDMPMMIGSVKNNHKMTFQSNNPVADEVFLCENYEWPKDTRLEFEKEISWKRIYDMFFVREQECSTTDRMVDTNVVYYDMLRSIDDFMYNWIGIRRRSCLFCGDKIIINNYGYCSFCFFKVNIKKKINEEYQKIIDMINNVKIFPKFIFVVKTISKNIKYVYKDRASIICYYVKGRLELQKYVLNNVCAACIVSDLQMDLTINLGIRKYWNDLFASILINHNVGKEYGIYFDRETRLGKDNNKRFDFAGKMIRGTKYIIAVEIDDNSHGKIEKINVNDEEKNAICCRENVFLVRVDFRNMKLSERCLSVFKNVVELFKNALAERFDKI